MTKRGVCDMVNTEGTGSAELRPAKKERPLPASERKSGKKPEYGMRLVYRLTLLLLVLALLLPAAASCRTEKEDPGADGTGAEAAGTEGETSAPSSDAENAIAVMSARIGNWFTEAVENDRCLFSCTVNGKPFPELAKKAEKTLETQTDGAGNTLYTLRYALASGLVFELEATLFRDFPTLDFVVRVRNESTKKSGQIAELCAIDSVFPLPRDRAYVIDTTLGACRTPTGDDHDFTLQTVGMAAGTEYSFSPTGGRSSNLAFPFFDILGRDCGLMVAIGWTGQWEASFSLADEGVRIRARQQTFDSYLKAGEEIRTPSVSITYFDGSAEYGHNLFRQLILAQYTPKKADGTVVDIPLPYSVSGASENIMDLVAAVAKEQLGPDTAWLDAGWYGYREYSDSSENGGWADQVGNWNVNPNMHPSGSLKELGDCLHSAGQKFMLWFECERAYGGTDMLKEHKNLFYPTTNTDSYLLALSQDDALEWLTEYISGCISEWGIDVYRQDFNIEPLWIWETNDEPNRRGMNENKYITNLYAFLDTLRARYPDLVIDNCASGGRRIDVEMLKRCLVMWRSDYSCHDGFTVEGYQYHTQNLNYWLPLHAAGMRADMLEDYVAVSGLGMENLFSVNSRYADRCKAVIRLYESFRPYLFGDYYQLLTPSFDTTSLQAYELFRPDLNAGAVVVMNRKGSTATEVTLKPRGLSPDARYVLRDQNGDAVSEPMTGSEWAETGVSYPIRRGKAVLLYIEAEK